MGISLLDNNLSKDNYNEYIERIYNIFRLSNKNSSIILRIKIDENKCVIELKYIDDKNGNMQEFSDVSFKCNDIFYKDFLVSLIKRLNDNEEFIINDIVNLDKDQYLTFRLVSSNNDLITIDGLTEEQANYLKQVFVEDEKKELNLITNNNGMANIWLFLLMIIVLVIAFILIVWLVR